jgi:aspartate/methionine/tyrosine aminotransferase
LPRRPNFATSVTQMRGSVFTALAHRLATFEGEVYPFHVGDTWMEPAEGCRMEDLTVEEHPGLHRYEQPQGRASLIQAIAERTERREHSAPPPVLCSSRAKRS